MAIFRYAGFAAESASIDDAAPAAAFHVDISGASLDVPSSPQIEFAGGMGRGRNLQRPGFYAPSGNMVYASDIKTIGWFLKWAMGGYVYTAGTAPALNTHEIYASAENFLDTFCARIGKDYFEHVFRGCTMNSLEIAVDAEFAQLTADINARKDARADLKTMDELTIPEEHPFVFHEVTATRNAGDVSAVVNSLTFSFSNSANTDAARHIGSRFPGDIPVFEREVNISATLKYRSIDELQRFWGGNDGPSNDGQTEFGFAIKFDAGDDGELELQMPRCIYDTVPTQPSGRGELTQNVVMHAYQADHTLDDGTTTINSEVLATLQNNEDDMEPGS